MRILTHGVSSSKHHRVASAGRSAAALDSWSTFSGHARGGLERCHVREQRAQCVVFEPFTPESREGLTHLLGEFLAVAGPAEPPHQCGCPAWTLRGSPRQPVVFSLDVAASAGTRVL